MDRQCIYLLGSEEAKFKERFAVEKMAHKESDANARRDHGKRKMYAELRFSISMTCEPSVISRK